MLTFDGLKENFKFLVIETINQAGATQAFMQNPSKEKFEKIVSRDDYIDNLKNIIENKCFSKIHRDGGLSKKEVDSIRAMQICCVNLERIADFCVNVVRQMEYLHDPAFLGTFDYSSMFDSIRDCLGNVLPVWNNQDLAGALSICRCEYDLDRQYKDNFDRIMAELRTGLNVEALITTLFIFRYLERIGDSLLNIGEAMVFSILGEKIKIEQFEALSRTLDKTDFQGNLSEIDFQSYWGTRSGCRISKVEARQGKASDTSGGIFKEGNIKKVRREKENIESWNRLFPGLGPRIYGYHEEGDNASLLVEFLSGCTLDEVVLTAQEEPLENATFIFEQTIREIWESTRMDTPKPCEFVDQIRSRMGGVVQLHPEFSRAGMSIGKTSISSMEQLLERCRQVEAAMTAPFTVFLHGDFNSNNIVYDHSNERIHLIDFYRSGRGDYIQDASVFLVSNFRIPVFEEAMRDRLNWVIEHFLGFVKGFAEQQDDATWQARMALGLARSFYTSTRFEMNREFATDMYLRSLYLLECFLRHEHRPWEEFELPEPVLYY